MKTKMRTSRGLHRPSFAGTYFSFGIGCFGSVEHSPLPLQAFLPVVEGFLSPVSWAIRLALVPATKPVRAAPTRRARSDFVIAQSPSPRCGRGVFWDCGILAAKPARINFHIKKH